MTEQGHWLCSTGCLQCLLRSWLECCWVIQLPDVVTSPLLRRDWGARVYCEGYVLIPCLGKTGRGFSRELPSFTKEFYSIRAVATLSFKWGCGLIPLPRPSRGTLLHCYWLCHSCDQLYLPNSQQCFSISPPVFLPVLLDRRGQEIFSLQLWGFDFPLAWAHKV